MTDLEQRVSAVLAERVHDREYAVDRVRVAALRRGRTLRIRRRMWGTTAAVIAVIAGVFVAVRPAPVDEHGLPVASAGGEVGSDPALLHFELDESRLPERVASLEWFSGIGRESVFLRDGDDQRIFRIYVTPDEGKLKQYVAGDAEVYYWQPAAGLYGAVVGKDRDTLPDLAGAVEVGPVHRCVVPMRLSELPPGGGWDECGVALDRAGRFLTGALGVQRGDGTYVYIWADSRVTASPSTAFVPDRSIGDRPAMWRTGKGLDQGLWVPGFGPFELYVTSLDGGTPWMTAEDAAWFAERLTPSADLGHPSTWPRRAIG